MTTTELVAELKRLDAAATPGPWGEDEEDIVSDVFLVADWVQKSMDRELIIVLRNALPQIIAALEDTERLDACADQRIVDGIGKCDIDETTCESLDGTSAGSDGDTEERWNAEWRKQFRRAIDKELRGKV